MDKNEEGGRIAIRGFQAQALIVLLQGLSREDWETVKIEPEKEQSNTDSMQMVDILWKTTTDIIRYDQVKYSINPFPLSKVKNWAANMNKKAANPNAELHIYLLGSFKGEIQDGMNLHNTIVHTYPNVETVVEAAAHEFHRKFHGYTADEETQAVVYVSGILTTSALTEKPWTKIELLNLIGKMLESAREPASSSTWSDLTLRSRVTDAQISILTLIQEDKDYVAEVITFTAKNNTQEVKVNAQLSFKFAETGYIKNGCFQPDRGLEANEPIFEQNENTFTTDITFHGEFEPGETRVCGLYIEREIPSPATYRGGSYTEPLIQSPPNCNYTYRCTVILPFCSDILSISPTPTFRSRRTIIFKHISPEVRAQENLTITYVRTETVPDVEVAEERLKRLIMSRDYLVLGWDLADGVPQDASAIDSEIRELKSKCAL